MSDFRAISLVDSLYNMLTKVLANRLKLIVSGIVSDFQMTFVQCRQNLGHLNCGGVHEWRRNKKGGLLVKLDFEKA